MDPEGLVICPKITVEWAEQLCFDAFHLSRRKIEDMQVVFAKSGFHVYMTHRIIFGDEIGYSEMPKSPVELKSITDPVDLQKIYDPINNEAHVIGYSDKTNTMVVVEREATDDSVKISRI